MKHCSECHRPIGLMLTKKGKPALFKCPYTGRVAEMVDSQGNKIGGTDD